MKDKEKAVISYLSPAKDPSYSVSKRFFKEIYQEIYKRSGRSFDKYTFHEITGFPLIISEKLFYNMNTTHCSNISLGEFSSGLSDLYFGKIEVKLELIFHLFDFNNHKKINIDDVRLLFSYFHMINLTSDTEIYLMEIINNFFGKDKIIDYSEFYHRILNRSFDIIFLFFLFIKKYAFFTIQQIRYYSKQLDLNSSSTTSPSKESSYDESFLNRKRSDCFIEYAYMIINSSPRELVTTDEDDLKELNELEDFENDLVSVMANYKESYSRTRPKTQVNNSSNENTLSTFKLTNYFVKREERCSSKNLTQGVSLKKMLSLSIDMFDNAQFETKLFTMKKFNSITPCKIVIVDNSLFYFSWNKDNNFFFFKKVILLTLTFPKVTNKIVINNSVYTPLLLVSTIHNCKYTKTLISLSEREIHQMAKIISSKQRMKSVDDYFQFGPEIGKGKFGKVNFGLSIGTEIKVAIKIVSKFNSDTTEDDYHIMKWEKDIFKYLKNYHHPNIIKCIDIYETSSYLYYIYEYMPDGDLKIFLNNSNVSPKKIVQLVLQLIKGVSFLHNNGIIHRDIKHTNVMVFEDEGCDPVVKIIDFGLSRVLGKRESCVEPYGSLSFKAPEILLGLPYNFKVDIWSLGVTIYYLLFKELPFEEKTGEKIKECILNDNFSFPKLKEMSQKGFEYSFVFSLICDCLNKNIQQRPDINYLLCTYFKAAKS